MTYDCILTRKDGAVGVVTLNRPEALNALNLRLTGELSAAVAAFDADPEIGAILVAGSEKAFAAGADVKEIQNKTFAEVYEEGFVTASWEGLSRARKPTIAAVSGHAVGGGCEIAMMCDLIVAAESARFSLPETQIGILPGAGGTQRLTRLVGKAVAMDMILTGRPMKAEEALARGLVSRVYPQEAYLAEALALAQRLAALSRPILRLAKEAVEKAYETHLAEGIHLERRLLYSAFALEDRKEGLTAFVEKRKPQFRNR